jgi:hypothetical protein
MLGSIAGLTSFKSIQFPLLVNSAHITSDEVLTWNQIYDRVGLAAGVEEVQKVHIPSDFIVKMVPPLTGSLLGDKAISAVV